MKLPENSEKYKKLVLNKIEVYCNNKIWPFDYRDFVLWIQNFDCKKEEYLAIQMLDSLIVRSNTMAKVSYLRLLRSSIRQYINEKKILEINSINEWDKILKTGSMSSLLRFTPVVVENNDGGSGSVVFRLLSPDVDTKKYRYDQSDSNPRLLIIIDDIIGSGDQFLEYAESINLKEIMKEVHVMYCPFMAFAEGVNTIKSKFPSLQIIAAENLSNINSIFYGENENKFKNDKENTIKEVKSFYESMQKKYSPNMPNWLGHNELALPVVFGWGCPNHAPSILYMSYSKNYHWSQLFSRRNL